MVINGNNEDDDGDGGDGDGADAGAGVTVHPSLVNDAGAGAGVTVSPQWMARAYVEEPHRLPVDALTSFALVTELARPLSFASLNDEPLKPSHVHAYCQHPHRLIFRAMSSRLLIKPQCRYLCNPNVVSLNFWLT